LGGVGLEELEIMFFYMEMFFRFPQIQAEAEKIIEPFKEYL